MFHSTWVEIDRAALRGNIQRLQAFTGTRLMVVLKANGYGHGAETVARVAAEAGVMALGVARLDEGVSLRTAGITLPILVLGYLPPEGAAEAVGCDLTLTVFDYESAQAYAAAARANGRIARLHVKVETGMGRLGIHPENTPDLVRALHQLPGAEVEGIYTHLARADCADSSSARAQIARFEEVLAVLSQLGLRPKLRHAANSAGALFLPASRYDFIRAGIAVYGLPPSDELPCPVNLVPVLSWKAIVTQVKTLPAGHGISYGSEYVTREPETVAVLGAGYGDGFRRLPTGRMHPADVLLGGQRAPVRGRVCMDQTVVGISHIPGVRAGDEAVIVGQQGQETITASEIAQRWGTINYEVTSGIMPRVPRLDRR